MFEVTDYRHPRVFVTCRRTGETYLFVVEANGIVTRDELSSDQQHAKQIAIAYLAKKVQPHGQAGARSSDPLANRLIVLMRSRERA